MAISTVQSNNQVVKFQRAIWREYIRSNLFSPYMGTGIDSIIRTVNELKEGGEQINIPLVGRLNGEGKGVGTLVGNEEAIDNYGFRLWIDWARNAVATNKKQMHIESAPIWDEARPLLTNWGVELQRDEIILALHALPSTAQPAGLGSVNGQRVNGILYSAATEAQKDAWLTANSDRVLFGNAVGNQSAGDMSASLANLDNTADKASATTLGFAKRLAKQASPKIRPYRTEDGREYFVWFVNSDQFRDLSADASILAANKDARPREGRGMDANPIFQDGDLLYQGVIIREIPEMRALTVRAEGAAAIDVAPSFFCGQGSLGFAWGQSPIGTTRKEDDYGFIKGVGVEMAYGIGKMAKVRAGASALTDWATFTVWTASVGDV